MKPIWAAVYVVSFLIALIGIGQLLEDTEKADAHWTPYARHWHFNRQMSYYGPGFYGRPTACGKTMSRYSWHVAALKRDLGKCGLKLTVCHRTRCAEVRVQDRGAWRSDRRDLDATPRVKAYLRCSDLCTIRWRKGW